jgi:hypothetical protein
MRQHWMIRSVCILTGIVVLALLLVPAVHLPFIVIHGPLSALRAQQAAGMLQIIIQAPAFMPAGAAPEWIDHAAFSQTGARLTQPLTSARLNCAMRC